MADNKWASIGGSDISILMGLHPSRTGLDIWLRITGQAPEEISPVLRRGQVLEKYVRELASIELGMPLSGPKEYRWNTHGFPARASLDDSIDTTSGLEVVEYKTVSPWARHDWGESGSADVPLHYYMQVQWYLMAAQAQVGHIVALIGLDDLRHYRIVADSDLHGQMYSVARDWWDKHIVKGERPPLEGSSLETEWLKRTPQKSDDIIDGHKRPEANVFQELLVVTEQRKALEAEEEALKNRLKEAIGEAKGIRFDNGSVTWSQMSGRYVTDWEAVAKELGADDLIVGKHSKQKEGSRVFRVQTKANKS